MNLRAPLNLALICAHLGFMASQASAATFTEEMSRDFPLKRTEALNISNRHGAIHLKAWSQDRIRVVITKRADTDTEEAAKALFPTWTLHVRDSKIGIDVSTQMGAGLSLPQSLKARRSPQGGIDILVFAPGNMPAKIWGLSGSVSAENWGGSLDVRTQSGDITVKSAKGSKVSIVCSDCRANAENISADLRVVAGSKPVVVKGIRGDSLYVETRAAPITGTDLQVDSQTLVTTTGGIHVKDYTGQIHFKTHSGLVHLEDGVGSADGSTFESSIFLSFLKWKASDRVLVESQSGNIETVLPFDASLNIDVKSGAGQALIEFPVRTPDGKLATGSMVRGRVREGGTDFRLISERGSIKIRSGKRIGIGGVSP